MITPYNCLKSKNLALLNQMKTYTVRFCLFHHKHNQEDLDHLEVDQLAMFEEYQYLYHCNTLPYIWLYILIVQQHELRDPMVVEQEQFDKIDHLELIQSYSRRDIEVSVFQFFHMS